MKTSISRILSLLFLLLLAFKSNAQYDFYQYFDGADSLASQSIIVKIDTNASNVWQVGKPQKIIFDNAATVPNVIITDTINNYPTNNISRFEFKVKSQWINMGIYAVQWKQKLDLQKKHDGGIVEYSVNNGLTWQNAFNNPYVYNFFGFSDSNKDTLVTGEYAFSGTDSTWKDIWFCFQGTWLGMYDTLSVRFSLKSDSIDTQQEGWMIDNFSAHITYIHPVKEEIAVDYINVFPNPTKKIVNIEVQQKEGFHIIELMQLINSSGKVVQEWKNIPTRFWFDVNNYADGAYYLKVKTNLGSKTTPIIIQK